jgi:hypothetical protein
MQKHHDRISRLRKDIVSVPSILNARRPEKWYTETSKRVERSNLSGVVIVRRKTHGPEDVGHRR